MPRFTPFLHLPVGVGILSCIAPIPTTSHLMFSLIFPFHIRVHTLHTFTYTISTLHKISHSISPHFLYFLFMYIRICSCDSASFILYLRCIYNIASPSFFPPQVPERVVRARLLSKWRLCILMVSPRRKEIHIVPFFTATSLTPWALCCVKLLPSAWK